MTNQKQEGLYDKFIVTRTDGQSEPGAKHEMCSYFVLDLDHDPYAIPAALIYANNCAKDYPRLAHDLRTLISDVEKRRRESEKPLLYMLYSKVSADGYSRPEFIKATTDKEEAHAHYLKVSPNPHDSGFVDAIYKDRQSQITNPSFWDQ